MTDKQSAPQRIIAPSILASDFCALGEEIESIRSSGAQWVHIDVMDGQFTQNLAVGIPIVQSISKRFPGLFLDCHLMIHHPERFVAEFVKAGASQITIHVESETERGIEDVLGIIRSHGIRAGIALKPKTPLSEITPYLDKVDMVLVMTVEPGWGGQAFIRETLQTIQSVHSMKPEMDIQVDGGINGQTAHEAVRAGANVLVAGSAIFGLREEAKRREMVKHLQECE